MVDRASRAVKHRAYVQGAAIKPTCTHCKPRLTNWRAIESEMHMPKAKLGTKRACPNCESKFYDLEKDPIVCPICGSTFDPAELDQHGNVPASQMKSSKPDPEEDDDVDNDADLDEDDIDEEEEEAKELELDGDDAQIIGGGDGDDEENPDFNNLEDDEDEDAALVADEDDADDLPPGEGDDDDEGDLELDDEDKKD